MGGGDTGEVGDLTFLYDKIDTIALCHHILNNTSADQFVGAMESVQENFLEVMAKTSNDRGLADAGRPVADWVASWSNMRNLGRVGLCRLEAGKRHPREACCEGQVEGKEKLEFSYSGRRDVFEAACLFSKHRQVPVGFIR